MEAIIKSSKLFSPLFILFNLALICSKVFIAEAAKLPQHEVDALKIIGQKLKKEDWNFSVEPCNNGGAGGWITEEIAPVVNNVTCDCSYNNFTLCHVVRILLKGQNLTGVLPPEFANLTFLKELDLTYNYLNGAIPPSWGSLPLVNLSIVGNRISGSIPKEIGNITTLESLVLVDNQLQGILPPELGNLGKLHNLQLYSNNFTGELPLALGKLTNLMDFRISGNGFTGNIPEFIKNWTNLTRLEMIGTSLVGPIPSSISVLEKLTNLGISDLSSPVSNFPPLQHMASIETLILRNCSISDKIPAYIGDWELLKLLCRTGIVGARSQKSSFSLDFSILQ